VQFLLANRRRRLLQVYLEIQRGGGEQRLHHLHKRLGAQLQRRLDGGPAELRLLGDHLDASLEVAPRVRRRQGIELLMELRTEAEQGGRAQPVQQWNSGDEELHVRVEVRPALTLENWFETYFGLAQDGKVSAKTGLPNLFQLAVMMRAYQDVLILARPPRPVQSLLFSSLGAVGRVLGYKADYPYPYTRPAHAPFCVPSSIRRGWPNSLQPDEPRAVAVYPSVLRSRWRLLLSSHLSR
jgi:hypothetical protein